MKIPHAEKASLHFPRRLLTSVSESCLGYQIEHHAFKFENLRLKVGRALVSFNAMLDFLAIAATVAFFVVALAYVSGCNLL